MSRAQTPEVPVKVYGPLGMKQVPVEQTQCIHFLSELPIRYLLLPTECFKPLLNIFSCTVLQASIRKKSDKLFNMPLIPGMRFFRNTKNSQNRKVTIPKSLSMGGGGHSAIHSINPLNENIMRKYIRICNISQYFCSRHITPDEQAT
jgi:hypothetical protein